MEPRPGSGRSFSRCRMVCSSAYAGTASWLGTAARKAGTNTTASSAPSSHRRRRLACSLILGSPVLGARVLVLQPVAVLDRRHPRHAVAVEQRLLRQVVRLAVVLAVPPQRVLLHLQAAREQQAGAGECEGAGALHVGSFRGSFWDALGTWFLRGPSPVLAMRPCLPASYAMFQPPISGP